MVKELSFCTISHVIDSWDAMKRIKDYDIVAGRMLMKRFLEICPSARVLFGFPIDMDLQSQEVVQSKRFLVHAGSLLQMIDTAMNMLGPDVEILTDIMLDLGEKHLRYGVKDFMFSLLRDALLHTMAGMLGDKFTDTQKDSWMEVLESLTDDMVKAY